MLQWRPWMRLGLAGGGLGGSQCGGGAGGNVRGYGDGGMQVRRLQALQKETQKLRMRAAALKARREALAAHRWQGAAPAPVLHGMALRQMAIAEEEEQRARQRRLATRRRLEQQGGRGVPTTSLAGVEAALAAGDDEAFEAALASLEAEEGALSGSERSRELEEELDYDEILPVTALGSSVPKTAEERLLAQSHSVEMVGGKGGSKAVQRKERQPFKDRARVRVMSGAGGRGSISFASTAKKRRGPPSGGNGGDGGDVLVRVAERKSLHSVAKPLFRASPGANGSDNGRHGRRGETAVITVPPGTIVKRIVGEQGDREREEAKRNNRLAESQGSSSDMAEEEFVMKEVSPDELPPWLRGEADVVGDEDSEHPVATTLALHNATADSTAAMAEASPGSKAGGLEPEELSRLRKGFSSRGERIEVLATLDRPGDEVLVATGGRGGRGNMGFHHTRSRDKERFAERYACGTLGESEMLELELKLMADVGLVGFPNAGKSTLLRVVSNATPKVASYAFTTLHPTVGVVEFDDSAQLSIADLPGLIEGAHDNRGLGHQFLRHIERTKVLCFVLDMAGVDGRDPLDDWLRLLNELELYEPGLTASKQAVVAANKMDVAAAAGNLSRLQRHLREAGGISCPQAAVHAVSTRKGEALASLLVDLRRLVLKSELQQKQLY